MEHIYNTPTVSPEKSKIASFHSSRMKNIIVLTFIFGSSGICLFIFPVKILSYIAFSSISGAWCLHKSVAMML